MNKRFFTITIIVLSILAVHENASAKVERIVSLKPNITDILLELQLGDKIVGASTYCTLPTKQKNITRVADYVGIDIEKIIALKPDIIIASKENSNEGEIKTLHNIGMNILLLKFDTLDEAFESIKIIGKNFNKDNEAKALINKIKASFPTQNHAVLGTAKKTLVVLGQRPLVVAGPNTLLSEIIALLGGSNAVPKDSIRYPSISTEMLLGLNPDIIIDMSMGSENNTGWQNRLEWWQKYGSISAVKNKRIFKLQIDDFRAGPRLIVGVGKLRKIL